MAGSPRILAGFVQGTLEAIDRIDGGLGRRVRDELKPETREAIESRLPVSWLPLEMDVELAECLYRVAGVERAREAQRNALRESFEKPLLKPMLDGALGIFGRSPAKILRWAPKVWGFLIRDGGRAEVVRAHQRSARVEMRDLPPVLSGSQPYLDGVGVSILGLLDLLGVSGEVRLEGPDPATGEAAFELTWS